MTKLNLIVLFALAKGRGSDHPEVRKESLTLWIFDNEFDYGTNQSNSCVKYNSYWRKVEEERRQQELEMFDRWSKEDCDDLPF